jgi:hypothetical protein
MDGLRQRRDLLLLLHHRLAIAGLRYLLIVEVA